MTESYDSKGLTRSRCMVENQIESIGYHVLFAHLLTVFASYFE